MRLSCFLLAGSASTNPIMFKLAVGLMLAWKVAGYYGVDRYLLHKTLPAKGTVCVGEDQPFTTPLATDPDLAVSLSADLRSASVECGASSSRMPSVISSSRSLGRMRVWASVARTRSGKSGSRS